MPQLTIVFDDSFDKTLSDLVKFTNATSKADAIRLAVASYSYLKRQQREHKGAKVVVTDDVDLRKVIELP